jgi:hypothetical protein
VLIYSIAQALPVLTQDSEDFEDLHDVVVAAAGHHAGILIDRFDKLRCCTGGQGNLKWVVRAFEHISLICARLVKLSNGAAREFDVSLWLGGGRKFD